MSIKIATWNVNSIKVRGAAVQEWLKAHGADIVLLQELKGLQFPAEDFEAIGYQSAAACQKTYNGVAILSKTPIETVLDRLPGDEADEQARYLEADINGVRVINIYLPNGNPAPGPKYDYKLAWMDRLYTRLKSLRDAGTEFVIGGDFNVIPDAKDCYDPKDWINDALYLPETKNKFRALLNLGLTDAFRVHDRRAGQYSFWDYQAGCWPQNKGIRIDHFLLTPGLADRLQSCTIDKEPRGLESPSDHTPVIMELR